MKTVEELPGHATGEEELAGLGFQPLTLVLKRYVCLSAGVGCEWDTIGEVPQGPGSLSLRS
jgi:hypothetical protein